MDVVEHDDPRHPKGVLLGTSGEHAGHGNTLTMSASAKVCTILAVWGLAEGKRKGMFYLTTHSTHFIYGYMVSDIWQRTIQIAKEESKAVVCVILSVVWCI